MVFQKESEFENALIEMLKTKGWESTVIKYPTEKDLIDNWAKILFENNRSINRLNECPLTDGEMQQVLEQINALKSPVLLNGFINGRTVMIKRDNPEDKLNFGKEISLKIYDRQEIAAGQSRYQIVQQPVFPAKTKMLNDRRGDLMLLINGMPVIHIELKRSGVPVSQAYNQIKNYSDEGVFTGLFSLIQIFVAMTPEETVYFANPGYNGAFNKDYYFHWADFNNEPVNDWKEIATQFLSIPMAHQLIGFYTVADRSDGILKVMRSYQYYAASRISDKVAKTKWDDKNQLGGYIWHTTGSGKTMTSFKAAQLIADSKDADKVVFLTDRIELGTQSFQEYSNFAGDRETVQQTENTGVLITKLKSSAPENTLIVTSIQKMSNIKDEENGLNAKDIELINAKRLVFIIDEAHRNVFGDMLLTIKSTFPRAIFFGFTGTPIQDENQKKMSTTSTVFGNELHRYSIADGIRDKNVLGFDPYMVLTYNDKDLRRAVALEKSKAATEDEAINDPKKSEVFFEYMNNIPMAGYYADDGTYVKGIEDLLPKTQYQTKQHKNAVVQDIAGNWAYLSRGRKFHAIFATSSIPEAIEYYRLLKDKMPQINITCLFDPNIDYDGGSNIELKKNGLIEIMEDYNAKYGQDYTLADHAKFKKDISLRMAHKKPYQRISTAEQIDLLIVVDQMLTGYDSKWINTLYMDKVLEYENIIQAFSRTNRLFGIEKPFGTIRYYKKPHTMTRNIRDAVKLYSGDKPLGLFVEKLKNNLEKLNSIYEDIKQLFENAGVKNFEKLPEDNAAKGKFASLFNSFSVYLEAAKIQGFKWSVLTYSCVDEETGEKTSVTLKLDENTYDILLQRYKELRFPGPGHGGSEDVPYDIDSNIIEIDTGKIDADYMNSNFVKYIKLINQGSSPQTLDAVRTELHKSFALLSQEQQKYANIFMHDVESGDINVTEGKTLLDYINEYQHQAKSDQIYRVSQAIGVDEDKLRKLMSLGLKDDTHINENSRFDKLKNTVDKVKAREFFEKGDNIKLKPFQVNQMVDIFLRKFIISGGFEI